MTTTPGHFDLGAWPAPGRALLFLDFDGTLVDLAQTPDGIAVPEDLPPLLDRLHGALGRHLAIVSGRDVAEIARFLPDYTGDIHGGHGAQARIDGRMEKHPLSGSGPVAEVQKQARAFADGRDGLLAEMKDAGAVLHYRQAPAMAEAVSAEMERAARAAPALETHPAKMAVEVKPRDASKRGVVARVLDAAPDRIPLVLGDDTTDEPAMALAQDRGGLALKVGAGETCARQRLADPAAARRALTRWIERNDPHG